MTQGDFINQNVFSLPRRFSPKRGLWLLVRLVLISQVSSCPSQCRLSNQ